MSVVLVLLVALTAPGDRPVQYKPVQYWEARGDTLAVDMGRCKLLAKDLYFKNIKATCELMTREYLSSVAGSN